MSIRPPTAWQVFVGGDKTLGIKSAVNAYPAQYAEWKAAHPNVKQGSLIAFAQEASKGFAAKDYEALQARFPPVAPSLANFNSAIASMGNLRRNFAKKVHSSRKAAKSALPAAAAKSALPSAAANDPAEEAMRIANTIQDELVHLKSALGRLRGGTRKRRSLR